MAKDNGRASGYRVLMLVNVLLKFVFLSSIYFSVRKEWIEIECMQPRWKGIINIHPMKKKEDEYSPLLFFEVVTNGGV